MGAGGSSSKQSTQGSSSGTNTSYGSAMNLGQEQQFQNLWGQAGNMYAGGGGQAAGQQGMAQYGNMLGQAQGYNQQGAAALNDPRFLGQNNPQMQAYANQIGQQFNQQIMPGLRGDAMLTGGYGGSRAGIAQGTAAGQAQRNLQDFGAQLYGQDQQYNLQRAQGLNQNAAMAGTLGEAYGQLGQFGMSLPWYNLQQYAGLLGNPIMEDLGGTGTTSSSSTGSGRSGSAQAHIW